MLKKGILRFLAQVVVALLLLEIILRVIFYQETGRGRSALVDALRNVKRRISTPASLERLYKDYQLARPDSSPSVNKRIADEAYAGNRFEYAPWIEYRVVDFAGRYINSTGLIRKSVPDRFINGDTGSIQTIFFLGGSTMFGVNVTDRETITAAFVEQYAARFPKGKSIRAINYGIPAYHSYNELMLLTDLIYRGEKPDIVVFFDGLNDFLIPIASRDKLPYYYYKLKLASRDHISYRDLAHADDATQGLFDFPDGSETVSLADSLAGAYLTNLRHAANLGKANGFTPYFFIQPNPFFNYPNKANDPICDREQHPLVEKGYSDLEKMAINERNCYFLGNMLEHENGYPFIDRFHYSPSMTQKIAAAMVEIIGKKLNDSTGNMVSFPH